MGSGLRPSLPRFIRREDDLGHELVHSLQVERGAAISNWRADAFRINWLSFASGVPAFLAGWPEHDRRLHEREADGYSGT